LSPRPRLDHVRRPELLEAAATVIRRRGLENARVADVAEEAGTSAPSVLYYFASKAELLNEALTSAEERFYEELAASLEGIESARERLVVIVESGAGEGDYDAALWMELWAKALRDPELAATRAELDGRWRRTIAEVVRYGQERGEFGPTDPDGFAVLLGSLLDGLSVQIALRDAEVTGERVRELALRLAERELDCRLPAEGVAGFIGVSNLLPGVCENGGVRLAGGAVCEARVPVDCTSGAEVELSVRPEKIAINDEIGEGMVTVEGTIVERVYVGTSTQVIVELAPGVRLMALEQNWLRARSDDRWEIGDRVELGWQPEHALVLR
jgi:AcrR family transcriptional regulator